VGVGGTGVGVRGSGVAVGGAGVSVAVAVGGLGPWPQPIAKSSVRPKAIAIDDRLNLRIIVHLPVKTTFLLILMVYGNSLAEKSQEKLKSRPYGSQEGLK